MTIRVGEEGWGEKQTSYRWDGEEDGRNGGRGGVRGLGRIHNQRDSQRLRGVHLKPSEKITEDSFETSGVEII